MVDEKLNRRVLEDVFVTEGVPEETFVAPPNFNDVLVDIRHQGKPVIIEGSSGTGKTCTVKKILEILGKENEWMYLTARKADDIILIADLAERPSKGVFLIDDFHRLQPSYQSKLSDIAKIAAEEADPSKHPKLVLIGINQVGAALIHFSPDIAKRCGIHRIQPATETQTNTLVNKGCEALNIHFKNTESIHLESGGDYWLSQTLCKTACSLIGVLETQESRKVIDPDLSAVRATIIKKLETAYYESIKDFCRGRRFRPSNDPYFRILQFIATKSKTSDVDLVELANAHKEIAGSINNIKDVRLITLLKEKTKAGQYFYYNKETSRFSIEDPAVFYFLRNLDWDKLRQDCGFRGTTEITETKLDIAISFAGENRELARQIAKRLSDLDVSVYFDEDYEAKYLGKRLGAEFEAAFATRSRFVVCILDHNHLNKIWPTFERDVFLPRFQKQEAIPIYLDDTIFPGISSDLFGIKFTFDSSKEDWRQTLDDKVILKLLDRIG